jgi:hypothetical protein
MPLAGVDVPPPNTFGKSLSNECRLKWGLMQAADPQFSVPDARTPEQHVRRFI